MSDSLTPVRRLVSLAAVLMLSACSLTPDYQRPELAVPQSLPAPIASAASGTATSTATAPTPAAVDVAAVPWIEHFPDPRLRSLIAEALNNNRDLRVAILNIQAVRAAYQIQAADRLPSVNASISGTRQPQSAPPYALGTQVTGGLVVPSFELDLFGRVQALTEAASAQVLASQEARRAAHISLVASVANAYYTLWADRWQLKLAEQTLRSRQDALKLLQLKYDNGVLNELELRSGQSQVEAARVARAQAQRQFAQDQQSLALLVGRPVPPEWLPPEPQGLVSGTATATPSTPSTPSVASRPVRGNAAEQFVQASLWPDLSELPVGLSSDVLLKRPDVAQAEQQLIAANANIGAARAARFPRISLTTSAGAVSNSLSGLFDSGRFAWSFGGSLLAPIFDAGRTAAGVDAAVARRDIAIAQYDKAIQSAFKEVADALVARSTYAEQAEAQLAQAQAEAARLSLSTLRYDTGVASQLDLLDAQRALFAAQQAHIQAQLARQQAHISVYKALGGGWVEGSSQADLQPASHSVVR
ncbi:MAG: TolC family protein [Burkholderiales bacterium]|nr:TolC family protein [Burkholderiales bacterium]MBH2015648.1 TolC family protein [Burkholderiales bacterium]